MVYFPTKTPPLLTLCLVMAVTAITSNNHDGGVLRRLAPLEELPAAPTRSSLVQTSFSPALREVMANMHVVCASVLPQLNRTSAACLNRRMGFLNNITTEWQAPGATGVTIDDGIPELRAGFVNFNSSQGNTHQKTQAILNAVMNPQTGYLSRGRALSKQALNAETGMVVSSNSVWMNLINVTNITDQTLRAVASQAINATNDQTSWLNQLQSTEEEANTANVQVARTLVNDQLQMATTAITRARDVVYQMLTQLDTNLDSAESNTQVLADSLTTATDTLAAAMVSLNDSVPTMAKSIRDTISGELTNILGQYVTVAKGAAKLYADSSVSKKRAMSEQSSQIVRDQGTNAATRVAARTNTLEKSRIAPIAELRSSWGTYLSAPVFQAVTNSVVASTQVQTDDATQHAGWVNGNLTSDLASSDQTWASVKEVVNSERNVVGTSSGSRDALVSSTSDGVSQLVDAVTKKGADYLEQVTAMSRSGVDDVRTSAISLADGLNGQFKRGQNAIGNSETAAAYNSAAAAAALDQAKSAAAAAINVASAAVNQDIQNKMGDNINSVMKLGTSMGAITVDTTPIIDASTATYETAAEAIETAKETETVTKPLTLATATQDMVRQLLDVVDKHSENATHLVSSVQALLQQQVSTEGWVGLEADKTDQTARDGLSTVGGILGISADQFAEFIADATSQMQSIDAYSEGGDGKIMEGLVAAVRGVAQEMLSSQGQLDSEIDSVEQEAAKANAVVAAASKQVQDLQGNSDKAGADASAEIDKGINNAEADVDDAVGTLVASAGLVTSQQMDKVTSLMQETTAEVRQAEVNQMQSVADTATTVVSLLENMNTYMRSNRGELMNEQALVDLRADAFGRLVRNAQAKILAPDIANSADITQLAGDLRAANSTALAQLQSIIANLTTTGDTYTGAVLKAVNERITKFGATVGRMQNNLDADSASSKEALSSGTVDAAAKPQSKIDNLFSQLDAISKAATAGMNSVQQAMEDSTTNMSPLFGDANGALTIAGAGSSYASKLIGELSANADASGEAAGALTNNDYDNALEHATADANLKEQVAVNRMQKQKANVDALSGDSLESAADLSNRIKASIKQKQEQTDYVYDNVVQIQSKLSNQLGNIMSKVAVMRSDGATATDSNVANIAFELAAVQNTVSHLSSVFQNYIDTQTTQFSASNKAQEQAQIAIAMESAKKLSAIDTDLQTILGTEQQNLANGNSLMIEKITDGDLEANIDAVREEAKSYVTNEVDKIDALSLAANSALSTYTARKTESLKTLKDIITALEHSVAQSASDAILAAHKPVPTDLAKYLPSK